MLLPKRIKALTSFMTMMWLWSNWRNMLSYPLTWGKKLGYANYSVCTVLIYWLLIKHFLLFGMFEIIHFFRPICIPCTRETNAALHLVDQSCQSQGVITLSVCCIASSQSQVCKNNKRYRILCRAGWCCLNRLWVIELRATLSLYICRISFVIVFLK